MDALFPEQLIPSAINKQSSAFYNYPTTKELKHKMSYLLNLRDMIPRIKRVIAVREFASNNTVDP